MSHSIQVYHLQPLLPTQQKLPRQQNHFRNGLRLLGQCLVGQYQWFALAFLLLLLSTVAAIFVWRPVAYLLDYLLAHQPDFLAQLAQPTLISPLFTTSLGLLIIIVLLALLHSLTNTGAELVLANCGQRLGYQLRMTLFSHLQEISNNSQENNSQENNSQDTKEINEFLSGAARDVVAVENFVTSLLPASLRHGFLIIGALLFLMLISLEMAFLSSIGLLLLALFYQHFAHQLTPAVPTKEGQEHDLATITQELLLPVRLVQPYSNESYTQHRFAEYNQRTLMLARQAAAQRAQFIWRSKAIEFFVMVLLAGLGIWLVNQASLTVGLLLISILLIQRLFKPLRQLIQAWNKLDPLYASLAGIGALLDPNFTIPEQASPERIQPVHGLLTAPATRPHSTPFRPPMAAQKTPPALNQPSQTLQNVQISLNPGEMLAIVCPPASSSRIITELLANLQVTRRGQILIGHGNPPASTQPPLLTELDVMLQEPLLFDGSVTENIAYGCPMATQSEIMAAAKQANAHAFIENLPSGYATLLSEPDATLTPAARYCLAMARAWLRKAPILVLEPPLTDWGDDHALVAAALATLMQGKTILLIVHDQTQIEQANQVIVLQDDKITEIRTNEIRTNKIRTNEIRTNEKPLVATNADLPLNNAPLSVEIAETTDELQAINEALALIDSPQLLKQFPSITTALDPEAMRLCLQTALIGPLRSRAYTITRCTIRKASYQTSEGCMLAYAIEVREHATGQTWSSLLLARLFATPYSAKDYLQQLLPLADQITESLESAAFVKPFAPLPELNMVVQLFPLDRHLPTLVTLTNPDQMIDLFQTILPEAQNRRFLINECVIHVTDYAQQNYCRLRYQIDGDLANTRKSGRQVLYGKVTAHGRGKLTGPILAALRQRMQANNMTYRFQLPHFVVYEPALQLVLVEPIRGLPQLPQLLTTHLQRLANEQPMLPAQPGVLTWEKALDASARIATALHTAKIALGEPRLLATELASLQAEIAHVRLLSPALASRLTIGLSTIMDFAATTTALPLSFSYGNFTPNQPLFDQTACGLMDFDYICQAEPALDLGQFQAGLRLIVWDAAPNSADKTVHERNQRLADQFCTQFLHTYTVELGYSLQNIEQLHRRVQLYELLSLLHRVLQSWQTFETERLAGLVNFLEERLDGLDRRQ
ncbi:MAG: ABC transporter ATP-binding protein, partial [Chloroflexi bacterium]|nr:ABC transporter ATP-binding protein [Chloroflexota bacterium]